MDAEKLNEIVQKVFGPRGKKKYTSALGVINQYPDVIFAAIQGHVFDTKNTVLEKYKFTEIRDARNKKLDTKRNMSEWTGYHAEMIILSQMMNALKIDFKTEFEKPDDFLEHAKEVKSKLEKVKGVVICADASCCKHCGNILDLLGIEYYGKKGDHGLTGWWNPFTDKVAENGTLDFKEDIPGL